jgi:hypothetical protein
MDEYRAQLLAAARDLGAMEARQLSEDRLRELICLYLGLPLGTQFTDEQLEMLAGAQQPT